MNDKKQQLLKNALDKDLTPSEREAARTAYWEVRHDDKYNSLINTKSKKDIKNNNKLRELFWIYNVMQNRKAMDRYPDTYKGVAEDPWQFSSHNWRHAKNKGWKKWKERMTKDPSSVKGYDTLANIFRNSTAKKYTNKFPKTINYHATYVNPGWATELKNRGYKKRQVGDHYFYFPNSKSINRAKKYENKFVNDYTNSISDRFKNNQSSNNTQPTKHNFYKVQQGDTLSQIAADRGLNWKNIKKLNKIKDPKNLQIGERLKLPE